MLRLMALHPHRVRTMTDAWVSIWAQECASVRLSADGCGPAWSVSCFLERIVLSIDSFKTHPAHSFVIVRSTKKVAVHFHILSFLIKLRVKICIKQTDKFDNRVPTWLLLYSLLYMMIVEIEIIRRTKCLFPQDMASLQVLVVKVRKILFYLSVCLLLLKPYYFHFYSYNEI